ncbi:MAG: hypothetical protein AAF992_21225, partial [Bacteroidota bacterium]
ISGKPPWPWASRQVQVEGADYLKITRSFGWHWHQRVARNTTSSDVIFTLKKQSLPSVNYELIESGRPRFIIRATQTGQWICESADDTLEMYRLGGSKSIVSREGCQIAIMSSKPGIHFFNNHQIGLRVNKEQYLNLCIAAALLLDDFNLHLNTGLFAQPEVATLQPG